MIIVLEAYQIIVKTIATTVNILLAIMVLIGDGDNEVKIPVGIFFFLTLAGIWI